MREAMTDHYPAGPRREWPGLLPAIFAALDAVGRLLHIRWPGWFIEWAWNKQATPGPDELARKARRRDIYGDVRARLAAALLVGDEEWTQRCRRTWQAGDDGEQVRT